MSKGIILYTTDCPKCRMLKKKLDMNGVTYTTNTDVDEMLSLGLVEAPALKVDDELMNFKASWDWIDQREGN